MAETENKYFAVSVDQWDKISFHKTEEDAKKECLRGAEELLDYAIEIDDISVYKCQIHNAVYGVVLGKAVCKEKQLSEEEKEDYGSDLVLEKPELVEFQQDNSWISVKDRLPQPIDTSTEYRNQENKSVIYYTEDDEYWFIGFGWYVYGDKEDCDGCLIPYWELEDTGLTKVDVTHWQPLPTKPIQ
ncbi:TPA: DUF551 domain-containing protein [Pasteurella multocida]